MGRALTLFFGLLAFCLLAWFCLGHEGQIQREVGANAKTALAAGGFDFARATANGQTITLQGSAQTEAERLAAEQAALAAPGVIDVDNQIVLSADLPMPVPDSDPVVLDRPEESLEPVPAEEPPAPANPIPESLQITLDASQKRANVVGLLLSPSIDDARESQLNREIAEALPDWEVSSRLTGTANTPTDLIIAVQQILPALTGAQAAQIDVDAQGIRVNAELASFSGRTELETLLANLANSTEMAQSNLSWTLDSPSADVQRCQQAFDDLLGKETIMFTTNRSAIRQASLPLLDKLVEVASDCEVTIAIEGHTDSRGSAELNDALSQARADAIRAYLVGNGIDGRLISAKGFGAANPIADNNTVAGRQANRRIEFRVQRSQP